VGPLTFVGLSCQQSACPDTKQYNPPELECLSKDFTDADILMARVLTSGIKDEGLIAPYPAVAKKYSQLLK
jgi:hypothetical protein